MKNKYSVLCLLFFSAFSPNGNAQIGFAKAKDDNNSDIDYKVEWGYTYPFQSQTAAGTYLKNKGYKNISAGVEGDKVDKGFYVVVKSTY